MAAQIRIDSKRIKEVFDVTLRNKQIIPGVKFQSAPGRSRRHRNWRTGNKSAVGDSAVPNESETPVFFGHEKWRDDVNGIRSEPDHVVEGKRVYKVFIHIDRRTKLNVHIRYYCGLSVEKFSPTLSIEQNAFLKSRYDIPTFRVYNINHLRCRMSNGGQRYKAFHIWLY